MYHTKLRPKKYDIIIIVYIMLLFTGYLETAAFTGYRQAKAAAKIHNGRKYEKMNVLIVDDDLPYLRSLKNRTHWEALSVEKVYTASSASEAMDLLSSQAETIDLLITDIEMPKESGLKLIEWCREQNLPCLSIILSSFPDFSYAQQAISLGVFAYLLKTAEQSVLETMIRRAGTEMIRRRQETGPAPESPSPSRHISKIRFYISQHITENISREALAAFVGFTPDYLSSYFKKETGSTLNQYIHNEKIQFAKRMLLQTDLPVSVIAQNLGFETSSYFTALFKKTTGMTPREYRKQ